MQGPRTIHKRLPLTIQTAYSDLIARLREDAVLEMEGTPIVRERKGRDYWYAVKRVGDRLVERYLGPDSPDIREMVERSQKVKDDLKLRERQRSLLVRMCREGGYLQADAQTGKILYALSKAGVFRLRGVLVGTHAFRCYPGLLGVELPEAIAVTDDVDVATFHSISVAIDDRIEQDWVETLNQIGSFTERPGLHPHPTAWRDREDGALVELLTPNQGPDRDEPLNMPALKAYAHPMRFLDFLIHEPVQAAILYRSGVLVNVPQPARYAVHKLIVATRRDPGSISKRRKDIEQAAALIEVLGEDDPYSLADAYREALNRGPHWKKALSAGGAQLPQQVQATLNNVIEL